MSDPWESYFRIACRIALDHGLVLNPVVTPSEVAESTESDQGGRRSRQADDSEKESTEKEAA